MHLPLPSRPGQMHLERPGLWHTGPGNTEQPRIGHHSSPASHSVTIPKNEEPRTKAGRRSGVRCSLCVTGRKSSYLQPRGAWWEPGPPARGGAPFSTLDSSVCGREGSTTLTVPSALPLVTSQGEVSILCPQGPLRGLRIFDGSYKLKPKKSNVKKIPENTVAWTILVYDTQLSTVTWPVFHRDMDNVPSHTHTPPHTHPLAPVLPHAVHEGAA